MPERISLRRWWFFPATALLLCGVFPLPAAAQQELGTTADEDAFISITVRPKFMELVRKTKEFDPKSKDHTDYIEKAAKYYVWPVTWSAVRNAKDQRANGFPEIHRRFREVMEEDATRTGKNREFMKAFVTALIPRFKDVLGQKLENNTVAVTNCALMLPLLGKSKTDEAAEFFMSIIKEPKQYHPFIRMCAVRGLGETGPGYGPEKLKDVTGGDPKVMAEKRAKDLARLETIKAYIYTPMESSELPESPTPEHLDAYAFLRREGVKALAQFQAPALDYDAKTGKVVGPAAYYLALMFSRNEQGKYNLPLSERVEAAIGLCQLTPNEVPAYRAEVGLFLVGMTLAEMGNDYIKDYTYFSVNDPKDKTHKEFPPRQSILPWKLTKQRLTLALDEMIKNLGKESEVGKNADKMKKEAVQIFEALGKHGLLSGAEVNRFAQWVESIKPKSWEIYAKNKDLVIAPPLQVGAQ